jgi:hypothetical protein
MIGASTPAVNMNVKGSTIYSGMKYNNKVTHADKHDAQLNGLKFNFHL